MTNLTAALQTAIDEVTAALRSKDEQIARLEAMNQYFDRQLDSAHKVRLLNVELLKTLNLIAGLKLDQFMGPHDMALECVNLARAAVMATGERT